jgi:hypothetical protein
VSSEKDAALAALRGIRGDAGKARGASRMSDEERQRLIISIGLGGEEQAKDDPSAPDSTPGDLVSDAEHLGLSDNNGVNRMHNEVMHGVKPRVSRVFDAPAEEDDEDEEL